jgi:uncharacterized membrane protein
MQASAAVSPAFLILSSAGIAALVSAVANIVNQAMERKQRENAHVREQQQRRHELLLAKSVELALARNAATLRTVEGVSGPVFVTDPMVHTANYYKWMGHILEHGALPAGVMENLESSFQDARRRNIPIL